MKIRPLYLLFAIFFGILSFSLFLSGSLGYPVSNPLLATLPVTFYSVVMASTLFFIALSQSYLTSFFIAFFYFLYAFHGLKENAFIKSTLWAPVILIMLVFWVRSNSYGFEAILFFVIFYVIFLFCFVVGVIQSLVARFRRKPTLAAIGNNYSPSAFPSTSFDVRSGLPLNQQYTPTSVGQSAGFKSPPSGSEQSVSRYRSTRRTLLFVCIVIVIFLVSWGVFKLFVDKNAFQIENIPQSSVLSGGESVPKEEVRNTDGVLQSSMLKEPKADSRERQMMDYIKKSRGGGDNISIISAARDVPVDSNTLFFSFKFKNFKQNLTLDVYVDKEKLYHADAKQVGAEKWIQFNTIGVAPYQGKNVILSFVIEGDKGSGLQIDDLIFAQVEPIESATKLVSDATFVISNPKKDQVVNSPLVVEGKADAKLFPEGWFRVRLTDVNYRNIASANATASVYPLVADKDGNMPFYTRLVFDAKSVSTDSGFLFLDSNGSENLPGLRIPVRFR
ncbi:MAG: hypothetical protein AAB552_00455 [Patescibacteria group bacterium]